MELDLRHLRAISVVAELGSVTKAASALGIAQPALTARLGRMDGPGASPRPACSGPGGQ